MGMYDKIIIERKVYRRNILRLTKSEIKQITILRAIKKSDGSRSKPHRRYDNYIRSLALKYRCPTNKILSTFLYQKNEYLWNASLSDR
jgi:hypothetical protein